MPNDLIAEYIFANGKSFRPGKFPDDLLRGKVGDCFDTSIMNAIRNEKYKYVEGYAQHPMFKDMWILHAWLTDGEQAFDPTWTQVIAGKHYPVQTQYIGLEMDTHAVGKFMLATKYKAVIANGWRNKKAAEKVLPGFPFGHAQDIVIR